MWCLDARYATLPQPKPNAPMAVSKNTSLAATPKPAKPVPKAGQSTTNYKSKCCNIWIRGVFWS